MTGDSRNAILAAVTIILAGIGIESAPSSVAAPNDPVVGINLVTHARLTTAQRTQLAGFGSIDQTMSEINGLTMSAHRSDVAAISALPFVAGAAEDSEVDLDPSEDLA